MVERRDAGRGDSHQYSSVRGRWFWKLYELQRFVSTKLFRSHCTHTDSPFSKSLLAFAARPQPGSNSAAFNELTIRLVLYHHQRTVQYLLRNWSRPTPETTPLWQFRLRPPSVPSGLWTRFVQWRLQVVHR